MSVCLDSIHLDLNFDQMLAVILIAWPRPRWNLSGLETGLSSSSAEQWSQIAINLSEQMSWINFIIVQI